LRFFRPLVPYLHAARAMAHAFPTPDGGEPRAGADPALDGATFRMLADSIPQLAWMAVEDGTITWYNQRWYEYTGTTWDEVKGWGWRLVHHPAHLDRVVHRFRDAIARGEAWEDTFPLRAADGTFRRFLSRARPVRDEAGRIVRWFGTNTDVEDALRAEEALQVSEERYRLATRAAGEAIWDWDLESDTVEWSDGVRHLFLYAPGEVGRDARWWKEHIHPDDQARVVRSVHAVIDGTGEEWEAEYRFLRADGTYADVSDRGYVFRGAARALRMVGSMRDVTAERRHEQELRAARRAAEEANRAKSQFLAVMSHEIRTPINAIVGYNDLLEVGIAGALTPAQLAYVGKVRASSQHLLALVNDILDLSKVEAGEMTMRRERLPVRGLVASALELVAPQARGRGVELLDEGAERGADAYVGDEDRARQVLANLLSNAVKFTEPGGRVRVCARAAGRPPADAQLTGGGPWVALEVEDTGIGIPPEQRARVFEPFVQVDAGHTRRAGGTGLGLAISRRFARMMGGELTLRSAAGQGSCFTFWLPGVADDAEGAHWPAAPGEVPGLALLGHILSEGADPLVRDLGDRMAADPEVPSAHGLDRAQLEDHISTFLMEVGKALIALDEGGGEPALMSDGDSIQRTIARLHGDQRRRLGWTRREVEREFELQRDLVEDLVAREAPRHTRADVRAALAIVHRLLARGEQIALGTHDAPE
jgi:PAS domain S-box-containing protein